jgi:hypothetical protein
LIAQLDWIAPGHSKKRRASAMRDALCGCDDGSVG